MTKSVSHIKVGVTVFGAITLIVITEIFWFCFLFSLREFCLWLSDSYVGFDVVGVTVGALIAVSGAVQVCLYRSGQDSKLARLIALALLVFPYLVIVVLY